MKGHIFKVVATAMLWMLCHVVHAGTVTYVYTDPQGTPLAEADANGNVTARFDYAPYGTAVASMSPAPNGPGYTGHVNDPDTGLVYMQARYYDPAVGRFLSIDPVVRAAGNTSSFSRYLYAVGNPISNTDPDGREDCSYFCRRMRELSDKFSGIGQGITGNVSGSGAGPGGQMKATTSFINGEANSDIGSGLRQVAEVTDKTISLAPGGAAAICVTDGCSNFSWVLAAVAVIPVEGMAESRLASFADKNFTYLYQKVGAYGEHLKFGITKNPATRYTREELGGGRLKILASGSRGDMLKLERDLHETLPIGSEEGQKFYVQKQIDNGLLPPPYVQ